MLEEPSLVPVAERAAAVIGITVPRREMQTVMGRAVRELRKALDDQGLDPAGPLFAHHLRMDDEMFDFELGIPTEGVISATGRVRPGRLPAGTVARAAYRGGYEGLSTAWGALRQWIEEKGRVRDADLWEVYLVGPDASNDPSEWRTELNQPLRG